MPRLCYIIYKNTHTHNVSQKIYIKIYNVCQNLSVCAFTSRLLHHGCLERSFFAHRVSAVERLFAFCDADAPDSTDISAP